MLKDGITYLCFAVSEKKTAICFSFLDEIRLKFCGTYDHDLIAKAMAYSTSFLDFKRVLKEEMSRFGRIEHADNKIAEVSEKIELVKDTMKSNISKLWERDSQIEDLLEKTELLETESQTLKVNTKKLASKFWWKNFKIWVIIIVVVIVLTWLIFSLICGFRFQCITGSGGTHNSCLHESSSILYNGHRYNLSQLQKEPSCVIPHIVRTDGVSILTSCSGDPLRLTPEHLVSSAGRWVAAAMLRKGDALVGEGGASCHVLSVSHENDQLYFGLNCLHSSIVSANGVEVSTFGRYHIIPSLWIQIMSRIVGLQRASSWGDHIVNTFF